MEWKSMERKLFSQDFQTNRKHLFEEALNSAKNGKVLYILCNELNELPLLSQDNDLFNRHYMKMITFVYAKTDKSLVESLASLPDWQTVPCAIILDELSSYCDKDDIHKACGIVSLLIDSADSCSKSLQTPCKLFVSINKEIVNEDFSQVLQDLYFFTNK